MIRYLLKMPRELCTRPDLPRREAQVFMQADRAEEVGRIRFIGDKKAVATVRETLLGYGTGVWGAFIEEETTVENLVAAMSGYNMREYEPKLIWGDSIFETAKSLVPLEISIAEDIINLYAKTLPEIPTFEPSARAELIEELRLIMIRGKIWSRSRKFSEEKASMFLSLISRNFRESGLEIKQVENSIKEAVNIWKMVHLPPPPTPEKLGEVLRQLAEIFESPDTIDLKGFFEKLELDLKATATEQ